MALLERLATADYRTPQLQAAYLISRVLAEAGRTSRAEGLAAGLRARAAERNGEK